jgi:hypothetical protein
VHPLSLEIGVLNALPVVEAPVHDGWLHHQNPQLLSARHRARLVVEAPIEVRRGYFV